MIKLINIRNVAKYERKTLLRSWFLRIFVAIVLIYMVFFNLFFFAKEANTQWIYRALESYMPYINTLFINIAQAVVAVFLASDFLKQDKKLDTSEVIYTRPLANIEYVLGKTWAIISVFMGITFLVMLMAAIFNLVVKDVDFAPMYYLMYPMLLALPTLVYILGLSFILMILFKNQAVTFLVLLGYIGITLFYFKDKYYGIFDYIGFNIPLTYSEMIGFVDPIQLLMQRGMYLFVGISFIFATVRWINRLPQSPRWHQLNLVAFALTLITGLGMGYKFYSGKTAILASREQFLEQNNRWSHLPTIHIRQNSLTVEHKANRIWVESAMTLVNTKHEAIDTFVLALNPGFNIDAFTQNKTDLVYHKYGHLLLVVPNQRMQPQDSLKVVLTYHGNVDSRVCYLDVLDEDLMQRRSMGPINIENLYGMISTDYVLLTPEILWYPVGGVTFNLSNYLTRVNDFTQFNLIVTTRKGLTPISQGAMTQNENQTTYITEQPLNALSLIIGDYEKKSVLVDSLDIQLFMQPGHDYFTRIFPNLADTLSHLIKDQKNNYESNVLDLYLTFNRVKLVEVPIQFQVFDRVLGASYETMQPEMFLVPEKGASLKSADFARSKLSEERNNNSRNEVRRPIEMEARIFRNFLQNTFFTSASSGFSRGQSRRGQRNSGTSQFGINGVTFSGNPLSAFPLYYDFTTGIVSNDFPMFNTIVSTYLQQGFTLSTFSRITGGMGDVEKANMALKENSIEEIIKNKTQRKLLPQIITQKGSFLVSGLKNEMGIDVFDDFLYYYIEDRPFQTIDLDQMAADLMSEYNIDINTYLESINTFGSIPKFLMGTASYYESRDDIGPLYIVRFKMSNLGDVKGLVNVSFRIRGGGSGGDSEERIYNLEAGETKEIQIVLFDEPRMMNVNTLVSENIPSSFSVFLRQAEKLRKGTYEEYQNSVSIPVELESKGDLVIDNEDEGFEIHTVSTISKLKRYLESKKEAEEASYEAMNPRYSPSKWKQVAHTAFYGKSIRSAWYIRSGDGSSHVTWKAPLKEKGFYDLYAYFPVTAMMGRSGGRERGQRGGGPSFADGGTDYHYYVYHGDEQEEIEYKLPKDLTEGWSKIGTFFLEDDSVKIRLTNQSSGKRIFADAVKLVKRENN